MTAKLYKLSVGGVNIPIENVKFDIQYMAKPEPARGSLAAFLQECRRVLSPVPFEISERLGHVVLAVENGPLSESTIDHLHDELPAFVTLGVVYGLSRKSPYQVTVDTN